MNKRSTGGSSGAGGYEYQARVLAFVGAHILARLPLNWTSPISDIPETIEAETGRAGDDIEVGLVGGKVRYTAQVKSTIGGARQLASALAPFVTDLPSMPETQGVLVVGPRTNHRISYTLRSDLDRWRQGRFDPSSEFGKQLLASLAEAGQSPLAERLHVVSLSLDAPSDAHRMVAIAALLPLLRNDPTRANLAWTTLVEIGHDLISRRGRHTRESLEVALRSKGLPLDSTVSQQESEVTVILRKLAAVHGIAAEDSASAGGFRVAGQPAPQNPAEAGWQAQLAAARQLLDSYQPEAALPLLHILDETLAKAGSVPSNDLRRRVRANIGVAHIRRGAYQEAARWLAEALVFGPNDPQTLLNLARVELFLGETEAAFSRARIVLADDPHNPRAWSILVEGGAEPPSKVPDDLAGDPLILTARALLALRATHGDVSESRKDAVSLLRRAREVGATDPETALTLSQALTAGPPDPVSRSPVPKDALEEGLAIATMALDELGSGYHSSALAQRLHLQRANTLRALGRDAEALLETQSALAANPVDPTLRLSLKILQAGLLLERGEPLRALTSLEDVERSAAPAGVHLMRARALSQLGRAEEADTAISEALTVPSEAAPGELRAALTEVALNSGLLQRAEGLLADPQFVEIPWLRALLGARLEVLRGNPEKAEADFQVAIEGSSHDPDAQRRIRYEYAMSLGSRGRYAEVLPILDSIDAWHFGDGPRRAYMATLQALALHDRAAPLLVSLESEGPLPPWALRAAVTVASVRNDLESTIKYLERLRQLEPSDYQATLFLATAYQRLHRTEEAIALFAALLDAAPLRPAQRMQAAFQMFQLGAYDKALQEAFRIARQHTDDPKLQQAFVELSLSYEQLVDPTPVLAVEADTRVSIRPVSGGDPIAYMVLSEGPVDRAQNEFLSDDPAVAFLIGAKVGDTVKSATASRGVVEYEVLDLVRADAFVTQDILRHFEIRHPESAAFTKMPIGTGPEVGSLQPLITQLQAHADMIERAFLLFDQEHLPLGTVSRMVHRPTDLVYQGLTLRGNGYWTEGPTVEDRERTLGAIASGRPGVLTNSAVYTARAMGSLGPKWRRLVKDTFGVLITPQSLIDELEERASEVQLAARKGAKTIGIGPAGIQMSEATPEATAAEYARIVDELGWLRTETQVVPRSVEALGAKFAELRDLCGDSGADAIDAVRTHHAVLIADDFGLRFRTDDEVRTYSTSSWGVLWSANAAGAINAAEFKDGVIALLRLHHMLVPVSAPVIIAALRGSAFTLDDDVRLLLKSLRGTHLDVNSIVSVIAETARDLALESVGSVALAPVFQVCIEHLTAERRIGPTLALLERRLDAAFGLLPLQRATLQSQIDRFRAASTTGGTLR